jgi:hypothetical protein
VRRIYDQVYDQTGTGDDDIQLVGSQPGKISRLLGYI